METEPPAAAREFRDGARAVVDESLLIQFGAKPGDRDEDRRRGIRRRGRAEENAGRSVRRGLASRRGFTLRCKISPQPICSSRAASLVIATT